MTALPAPSVFASMNQLFHFLLALGLAWPIAARAAGDAEAGRRAFARCASCHQVGPNAHSAFGPQLNGVLGRRAGSLPDYRYSDAMKRSGIVWDEQTLSAFLKSPGDLVPGTRMRFFGIGDEQRIADLIAYLRSAR
jgi:cytochrome c